MGHCDRANECGDRSAPKQSSSPPGLVRAAASQLPRPKGSSRIRDHCAACGGQDFPLDFVRACLRIVRVPASNRMMPTRCALVVAVLLGVCGASSPCPQSGAGDCAPDVPAESACCGCCVMPAAPAERTEPLPAAVRVPTADGASLAAPVAFADSTAGRGAVSTDPVLFLLPQSGIPLYLYIEHILI